MVGAESRLCRRQGLRRQLVHIHRPLSKSRQLCFLCTLLFSGNRGDVAASWRASASPWRSGLTLRRDRRGRYHAFRRDRRGRCQHSRVRLGCRQCGRVRRRRRRCARGGTRRSRHHGNGHRTVFLSCKPRRRAGSLALFETNFVNNFPWWNRWDHWFSQTGCLRLPHERHGLRHVMYLPLSLKDVQGTSLVG